MKYPSFFASSWTLIRISSHLNLCKADGSWSGGQSCLSGTSGLAGSSPTLACSFQRNKCNYFPRSLVKMQYCHDCSEPPWPRGSVLSFRLTLRIMCHLIHLTILRKFSWPSFAYMSRNVAWRPIYSFIQNLCCPAPCAWPDDLWINYADSVSLN